MSDSDHYIEALLEALPPETPPGDRIAFRAALYKLAQIVRLEQMSAIHEDLQRVERIFTQG